MPNFETLSKSITFQYQHWKVDFFSTEMDAEGAFQYFYLKIIILWSCNLCECEEVNMCNILGEQKYLNEFLGKNWRIIVCNHD